MSTDIQTDLKEAIRKAHTDAQQAVASARGGIDDAIDKSLVTAQLVEKAKQLHKQDVRGYLSEILTGNQVKGYISLNHAAKKRPTIHDKQQLFLCGIIDPQSVETPRSITKPTPTMFSGASKFIGSLNKTITKRPVNQWERAEKDQMLDVLEPVRKFIEELRA